MKALVGVLLAMVSLVVSGLAISDMWGWFIVPLGLPTIGVLHAMGIRVLLALLIPLYQAAAMAAKDERVSATYMYIPGIVVTLSAWGFGWATHMLMELTL